MKEMRRFLTTVEMILKNIQAGQMQNLPKGNNKQRHDYFIVCAFTIKPYPEVPKALKPIETN
jgi:hypothetical protein